MNFLSNFLALYNSLPEDDVYFVAMRNLLANRSELAEATIYDMAEICAVSRTTLNRLSKLLGYGSFKEFRYDMVRAFSKFDIHNRLLPARRSESVAELKEDVTAAVTATCRIIEENMSADLIGEILEDISAARSVDFYMEGTTGVRNFQTNLIMDDKDSAIVTHYTQQLSRSKDLREGDVVFMVDVNNADSLDPSPVFRRVEENNATLVLLGGRSEHRHKGSKIHYLNVMGGGGVASLYGVDIALAVLSRVYRQTYMDYDWKE